MRSPCTPTKSSPRSLHLEKAHAQQGRPNAARNKQINKFMEKNNKASKVKFIASSLHQLPSSSPHHHHRAASGTSKYPAAPAKTYQL